jgi:hypothetical protein
MTNDRGRDYGARNVKSKNHRQLRSPFCKTTASPDPPLLERCEDASAANFGNDHQFERRYAVERDIVIVTFVDRLRRTKVVLLMQHVPVRLPRDPGTSAAQTAESVADRFMKLQTNTPRALWLVKMEPDDLLSSFGRPPAQV